MYILISFHVADPYYVRINPCTDLDWDGTVREQTNFHLAVLSDFKTCYIYINSHLFNVKPPFQRITVK